MADDPQSQHPIYWEDQVEQADIAKAITASLTSPKPSWRPGPDRWIPQTAEDWRVYYRQKGLEDTVQDTMAFNKQEASEHINNSPLGPVQTSPRDETLPRESCTQVKTLWSPAVASPKDEVPQTEADHSPSRPDNENGRSEEPKARALETETSAPKDPSPHRQTIEDRIREMELCNPVDLPWIDDHDGDTYVFIDPSAQQPEQSDQMYQAYVERYQKPLLIRSDTLKRLHSSYFDERLKPGYQYRTIRRRGLVGRLPSQVKYVIDLTPPTEGDEAVWLMSELCCVDGVREWSQSEARWQVSKTLVGGRDEFTSPAANSTDVRPPPELSPIRHRASIERVLLAIRGIDPKLDSAVKVYTTFAVARFFDISQSPLTDYIIRWIRAAPNSLFIEALPEIALKIGDGLQCWELIRDSFAILVGEEALEIMSPHPKPGYSVYGRKKYDVPESYKTRIEYASKSFLDRILQSFGSLAERDMKWMESLNNFRRLLDNTDQTLEPVVKKLKSALKAFVRGNMYRILWSPLPWGPSFQLGYAGGDFLYPRTSSRAFWDSLDAKARIMTTASWEALKCHPFNLAGNTTAGMTNLNTWSEFNKSWIASLSEDNLSILKQEYGVVEVLFSYLEDLAERCRRGRSSSASTDIGSPTSSAREIRSSWDPPTPPLKAESSLGVALVAAQSSRATWDETENASGSRVVPRDAESRQDSWSTNPMKHETDQSTNCEAVGGIDFDLLSLGIELESYMRSTCLKMLIPPDADRREPLEVAITPTLVSLEETEWKYLPLYAGGLDDGSGGVFNDDVPVAEAGFSTAGPRVHIGTGSSTASSEFDFVEYNDLESTHHTSIMTNDGFSDQLDHRRVYDGNSELWDVIMKGKNTTGSVAASHMETGTVVAPSTTDADSEDGFVLPVRNKNPDTALHHSVADKPAKEGRDGQEAMANDQDDYDDIFVDSDDEQDVGSYKLMGEESDNDDTATEKGDDEHVLSEDEDMVLV
ncbi:MAG: hypothetical protein L6R39_006679 [Caloplaca ligustica]|nr:MAG: hypothetical protein L6R39_006679 [Caloplaca ligustica]